MADENLQKLHGDGPLMTNASVNRDHAVRMFKAGMKPEEIAREFPKVFTFKSGEDGGLGQKYDSIYVDSGRKETKYMITKSAVDEAIARRKAAKKMKRDFEKAVKSDVRAKREENKRLKAHIAYAKKEIAESAKRGEQPHLRTKEDIERTAQSFGQVAYFEEKKVRDMTRKHESGGNPRTSKKLRPSDMRPGHMSIVNVRHPEWGTWGVVQSAGRGLWEIRGERGGRILDEGEFGEWRLTAGAAAKHEAGKNPLTKREFDTLTKQHGGTGKGGDSGLARDEIAYYRRSRKLPGRGSDAQLFSERDLLAERAAERRRHPTAPLRGLQSAPKAAGGMAYLRSWGESIARPLKGDPHQLSTMSREELRAYRGGAGKKDAALKARIDKLLGKK
jgi:hypothetical protein